MKYISLIILVALTLSCRKEIPVNVPDRERKIVLNTLIQADGLFEARVFRSNHVQDRTFELLYLNNATVGVYENNTLVEVLPRVEEGFYKSINSRAVAGHEYEFRVAVPNLPSCSGTGKVLEPVSIIEIDSIGSMNFEFDEFYDTYEQIYQVYEIKFNDDANEDNYYRLKVSSNNNDSYDPIDWRGDISVESNDVAIEVWPYFDGYYYFSDVLFNGEQYNFTVGLQSYESGEKPVNVYLEHISKDFFMYIRSADFQSETKNDALFSQTVQVLSNISNGFGIVGTASVSKKTLTVYGQGNDEKDPYNPDW